MTSIHDDISYDISPRPESVPYTDAGMHALAKYARDGWVLWVQQGTKKVPMVHGRYVDDAAKAGALLTLAQARMQYETRRGVCRGLGLYLRAPVVGIDLDDVVTWRNGQPVYSADALAIMKRIPTYTELSPSGTGLHLYMRYDGDHTALPTIRHYALPHGGKIAIYAGTNAAYLTVTGRSVGAINGVLDVLHTDLAPVLAYTTPSRLIDDTTKPATPAPMHPPQTTPTPPPAAITKPATPDPIDATPDPTPARMVKYDAVPRMAAWLAKAWPARVDDACATMAAATDGDRHNTRYALGKYLGASLRALEIHCDAVGVPRSHIPAPATHDDIVQRLYDAHEPTGNKDTKRTERKAIRDGVDDGYVISSPVWSDPMPPALAKILHDAGITMPAPTQPDPTPASKPRRTDAPPTDHTTAPPAPAEIIIDFSDIITPYSDAVHAFIDEIRKHGITKEMLYSTAPDVIAAADKMPPPIIASIHDNAHLLMPGVWSLSAPSKLGKSTMALHLAYAVATGGDVFGSPKYAARRGDVVYFDLENMKALTGDRMQKMFDEKPMTWHYVSSEQWNVMLAIADMQKDGTDRWRVMQWYITDVLRAWPDTRLLILDNVIQFQPKTQRHETARDAEEKYLRWLAGVADMHPNLCIMLIDHNTKMQSTDRTDKDMLHDKQQGTFIKRALLTGGTISVSKAPPNADTPDGALSVSTRPRACAPLDIVVKLDDTYGHHVMLDVKPLQMSKQQRQIYDTMRTGITTPKGIAEALHLDTSAVTTQLDRMRAKGLIYKAHHGEYIISEASHRHTPPQITLHATEDESEAF